MAVFHSCRIVLYLKELSFVLEGYCFASFFANHTKFVCEMLVASETRFACLRDFGRILSPYKYNAINRPVRERNVEQKARVKWPRANGNKEWEAVNKDLLIILGR